MGVISASGNTLEDFQRNLWHGVSSVEKRIRRSVRAGTVWAGRVKGPEPKEWLDDRVINGTDLGQQHVVAAAELGFGGQNAAIVMGAAP